MDLVVFRKKFELLFDRTQNSGYFFARAFQVLSRQNPKRNGRNFERDTPFEQVIQLVGTRHINVMRINKMGFAAIASVAIENESNVMRDGGSADLPIEVALVNAVDRREQ